MARNTNFSKPKDVKGTLLQMGSYLGRHKLTMAVIAILVTAPLGALAIDASYKKLLERTEE